MVRPRWSSTGWDDGPIAFCIGCPCWRLFWNHLTQSYHHLFSMAEIGVPLPLYRAIHSKIVYWSGKERWCMYGKYIKPQNNDPERAKLLHGYYIPYHHASMVNTPQTYLHVFDGWPPKAFVAQILISEGNQHLDKSNGGGLRSNLSWSILHDCWDNTPSFTGEIRIFYQQQNFNVLAAPPFFVMITSQKGPPSKWPSKRVIWNCPMWKKDWISTQPQSAVYGLWMQWIVSTITTPL